ncbi:ankyrin repeat domain-containing protein 66-like [Xenia sp. Carnegie-2017]|uniref:ankyrin repeat domain-containing protein 66-like n=1 Tax=Xenia sp. Carnegie-2017 TaxID=2897299 RepID=UPI001F04B93B|nr:ankyrin repeat domain-containing protein 66-like [Xenia sp. Carnegie-2017]XP_046859787.1 ankyrin repeat domain-containing protein 66-like [Xenia sp. Carnegie-2017]
MSELVLHEAAASGDYHELQSLLLMGKIDVNHKDVEFGERTALHWAAAKGHASCIKLLLEHKADATARMVGGWTPAHCAAEEGHVNCLRALQEHGGAVCLKDDTGDSPRRVAEIYGHVDCVEFLKSIEESGEQRIMYIKDTILAQGRKIGATKKAN